MTLTSPRAMRLTTQLFILFALLIGGLCSQLATAEEKIALYTVEVEVDSQNSKERLQALRRAMAELVVRATGTAISLESAQVRDAISSAKSYVQQFAYKMTSKQVDGEAVDQLRLRVVFDKRSIQRLLREARLPLWSGTRPTMVVWLALSENGQRRVLSASDAGPILDILRNHAVYRGVPIVLPLLDLQDSAVISEDDLWSLRADKIYTASERYQADVVLAGRLLLSADGRLVGDWLYFHEGETTNIEGLGATLQEYLDQAIDRVADNLAQKYAIHPSSEEEGSLKVVFRGVQDFKDFSAITHYIQQLVSVRQVKVRSINRDVLVLSVRVDGNSDQVVRMFSRNRNITPIALDSQSEDVIAPDADFVFQWQRQLNPS